MLERAIAPPKVLVVLLAVPLEVGLGGFASGAATVLEPLVVPTLELWFRSLAGGQPPVFERFVPPPQVVVLLALPVEVGLRGLVLGAAAVL